MPKKEKISVRDREIHLKLSKKMQADLGAGLPAKHRMVKFLLGVPRQITYESLPRKTELVFGQ
jgi:hypothetical protein